MRTCACCGRTQDDKRFSRNQTYCRDCDSGSKKAGMSFPEYREFLKKQPRALDGFRATWLSYAKPGEPRWQIDDIKTGEHFAGEKKRAFLNKFIEVLKRG